MAQLAQTDHFSIHWFSGADRGGLYISETPVSDGSPPGTGKPWTENEQYLGGPESYVSLSQIPGLILELRSQDTTFTLFSRVSDVDVPTAHRRPKKDGGVRGQAYYVPLVVQGHMRQELADALELACSEENVKRCEEMNSAESYVILDGDYLVNGVWALTLRFPQLAAVRSADTWAELPPAVLDAAPKQRLRPPSGSRYGHGKTHLRSARERHRCNAPRCIDYFWIKPGQQYVEHKRGSSPVMRYHLKCAFRYERIPPNWLNPHFEQYYALVEAGLTGWIDKEREKRGPYDEAQFSVLSTASAVEEFVKKVEAGYQLDSYEREEWREHLRYVPVDTEPYQAARSAVGLANPREDSHDPPDVRRASDTPEGSVETDFMNDFAAT